MSSTVYNKMWLRRRRKQVIAMAGGKCSSCSSTKDIHFHHIDRKTKEFGIGERGSYSLERLKSEMVKCIILCQECHIKIHESAHGTISRYRHHKCRCDKCRAEWNKQCRRWKAKSRFEP